MAEKMELAIPDLESVPTVPFPGQLRGGARYPSILPETPEAPHPDDEWIDSEAARLVAARRFLDRQSQGRSLDYLPVIETSCFMCTNMY